MNRAEITRSAIDPGDVLARVRADEDGAVVLFLGVVRDHNEGAPVTGLSYDVYHEMAAKTLVEIAAEAAERLGTPRVFAVHRVGELAIGEVSVAIAASSPHRAESFDAARYVIEEIKKRLPIWKKEHYVDGGADWLEGITPGRESGDG